MDATRDGVFLRGTVVECEKKPWTMNGQSGTSFNIYVRTGSLRDGALRVKVAPEQFGAFRDDERVELPVAIFSRASDYGGAARTEYKLDPDYVHGTAGVHAVPDAAGL